MKWTPEGRLLMNLGTGVPAADNNTKYSFNRPATLNFGPNADFFVADGYGNSRVVHNSKDGEYRVIGWALERTLEDDLTLAALRMALSQRTVQPGLVHHSDRGSQYASNDYTDLLKAHGIEISMSRKANPWDNAACAYAPLPDCESL